MAVVAEGFLLNNHLKSQHHFIDEIPPHKQISLMYLLYQTIQIKTAYITKYLHFYLIH